MDELIEGFDLHKINKSGAVFDVKKLDWMNSHYIKHSTNEKLAGLIKGKGIEIEEKLLLRIIEIEKQRMFKVFDVLDRLDMYVNKPKYEEGILVWKKSDASDAKTQLQALIGVFSDLSDSTFDSIELIEEVVKGYISSNGLQNGNVLWPMRVALSGEQKSPSPFELAWVLKKEEVIARLTSATQAL